MIQEAIYSQPQEEAIYSLPQDRLFTTSRHDSGGYLLPTSRHDSGGFHHKEQRRRMYNITVEEIAEFMITSEGEGVTII